MNENLIIAPVSDRSFHHSWAKGADRRFDILLVYCGEHKNRFREDSDYYIESHVPGKFQKIAEAIQIFETKVLRYKYVCMMDEDIIASTKQMNLMFDKMRQYDLDAAQPSIAHGFIAYRHTVTQRDCELRYVNFIEGMIPVFKEDLLFDKILPTFRANVSCWGLEWLWAEAFQDKKVAVLDSVGVRHKTFRDKMRCLYAHRTATVYYQEMKRQGVSPMDDLEKILASVSPETQRNIFREKGRIYKPFLQRLILAPLVFADNIKWSLYLLVKRFFELFNPKIRALVRQWNLPKNEPAVKGQPLSRTE